MNTNPGSPISNYVNQEEVNLKSWQVTQMVSEFMSSAKPMAAMLVIRAAYKASYEEGMIILDHMARKNGWRMPETWRPDIPLNSEGGA